MNTLTWSFHLNDITCRFSSVMQLVVFGVCIRLSGQLDYFRHYLYLFILVFTKRKIGGV